MINDHKEALTQNNEHYLPKAQMREISQIITIPSDYFQEIRPLIGVGP